MKNMNRVTLMGRICFEPELSVITDGTEKTDIKLAVNREFKNANGDREADFINVTAWRKTAVFICKYFHKGDGILLDGRLQVRTYEDKDGNNREYTSVIAERVFFPLSKKTISTTPSDVVPSVEASTSGSNSATIEDSEDLPF